jgi:phosphate transport system ATP-binding protein
MSSFLRPTMPTTDDPVIVEADVRLPAMEARDLSLGFGSATVLGGLNLGVPRGAITALIGPTGSGKTTFLRSLNRMNDRSPRVGTRA